MNKDEAKEYIRRQAESYLSPDRSGKGFICPICGSGSGKKGTGITTKDGIRFTCWTGCFSSSDIIDIIGLKYGLNDYSDKLNKAAELLNVTIDRKSGSSKQVTKKTTSLQGQNQDKNGQYTHTQMSIPNNTYTSTHTQVPAVDYTNFYLAAAKNIDKTTYHRGLTKQTLERFKIGYIETWTHPKAPQAPVSPRLIIPTSKESYIARDTRDELTEQQKQFCKSKVGATHIFNVEALQTAKLPIFVVEGEIDALSIIDVDGEAIGLGGTSMVKNLLKRVMLQPPVQPLIIALDNDEAGQKAAKELIEGLKHLNIPFDVTDISKPYKDANEALNADREGFRAVIDYAIEKAEAEAAAIKEAARDELKKEAVSYYLDDFLKNIEASKTATYYPTGFSNLDEVLDGGLYAGLYIVGAISSLGKTTFCLQLADQIARQGHDVLIFSLEMAREELIAKSISRLTFMKALERYSTSHNAKTTRGILTGSRYVNYSQEELQLINDSVEAYKQYGTNLYITEGIGEVDAEYIKAKVKKHITITGKAPIVIIDYLQIIAPFDVRATDKQNTDKAVLELKRLSRDYSIPVIGISSFNRENYLAPVNLASFKESGAIEYSSDVLIGLQYEGMDYQEGERADERQSRIRELRAAAEESGRSGGSQSIQVKVLKHRNGSRGDAVLDYYPMFNYFKESGGSLFTDGWTVMASTFKK